MATYATYFHLPATSTVVYGSPAAHPGAAGPHPTIQLHAAAQGVPIQAAQNALADRAVSDGKRKSVSAGVIRLPATNPQHTSPLFRLPAELRIQIYTALLCPDSPSPRALALQTRNRRPASQTHSAAKMYPAVLSTCRRIQNEATPILYSRPIFHAHPSLLTSLPHLSSPSKPVLSQRVACLITRWQLALRLDTDPRFTAAQARAAFSRAAYLEIRVWQAQFEACGFGVLGLFVGVRGVGIARVNGSVDAELARWLEEEMMREEERAGEACRCDEKGCMGWVEKREVLCGRCYNKLGVEGAERGVDLWRVGVR